MTHSILERKARAITEGLEAGTVTGREASYHAFSMIAVANGMAAPFLESHDSALPSDADFANCVKNAVEATSFLKSVLPLFVLYPIQDEAISQQLTILHASLSNMGMEKIATHYHEAYKQAGRFDAFKNVTAMNEWASARRGEA